MRADDRDRTIGARGARRVSRVSSSPRWPRCGLRRSDRSDASPVRRDGPARRRRRQGQLPVRRRDRRDADRGHEPEHRLVRVDRARPRRAAWARTRSSATPSTATRCDIEDLQLVPDMHLDSYRFSIEWARVEPQQGVIDEAAIQHYRDELDALRATRHPAARHDPSLLEPGLGRRSARRPAASNGPTATNLCGLGAARRPA